MRPMPNAADALCPMPYARSVPHLSEKGYIYIPLVYYGNVKVGDRVNLRPKSPTLHDLVRSDFERVDYIGIS